MQIDRHAPDVGLIIPLFIQNMNIDVGNVGEYLKKIIIKKNI